MYFVESSHERIDSECGLHTDTHGTTRTVNVHERCRVTGLWSHTKGKELRGISHLFTVVPPSSESSTTGITRRRLPKSLDRDSEPSRSLPTATRRGPGTRRFGSPPPLQTT